MSQYIVIFVFFSIALLLMLVSLKFSKYKERPEGCCGGGSCSSNSNDHKHGENECKKNKEITNKFFIDVDNLNIQ